MCRVSGAVRSIATLRQQNSLEIAFLRREVSAIMLAIRVLAAYFLVCAKRQRFGVEP